MGRTVAMKVSHQLLLKLCIICISRWDPVRRARSHSASRWSLVGMLWEARARHKAEEGSVARPKVNWGEIVAAQTPWPPALNSCFLYHSRGWYRAVGTGSGLSLSKFSFWIPQSQLWELRQVSFAFCAHLAIQWLVKNKKSNTFKVTKPCLSSVSARLARTEVPL